MKAIGNRWAIRVLAEGFTLFRAIPRTQRYFFFYPIMPLFLL